MNYMLLVVLAILLVNALIGRKVGFIKTMFSLFSMVIAIVLTAWISPTVNDLMKGNEKVYNYVSEKMEKVVQSEAEEAKGEAEDTFIEHLPLPKSIKDTLIKDKEAEDIGIVSSGGLQEYIVNYLTNIVINALAFIVTFLTILILLWLICFALNLISKLPILNSVNKTAGLLAGLVHGLVVVWIFFVLLTVFGGSELGKNALKMIGESSLLNFLYNNNLLLRFVTGAIKMIF